MPESLIQELPKRLENALQEMLQPGERVEVKLQGAFKEGLICTDRRVIVLKSGFMTGHAFGTHTFQLPYANVAGADVSFHLMTGYFELSAAGMANTPKSYWSRDKGSDPTKAPNCVSLSGKAMAQKFREASAFIMERVAQAHSGAHAAQAGSAAGDDMISKLERLAKLRESGVLTQEEFEEQKRKIIAEGT